MLIHCHVRILNYTYKLYCCKMHSVGHKPLHIRMAAIQMAALRVCLGTWLVSTGIGVKAACVRETVGPSRSRVELLSCLYSRLFSTFNFSFGRTAS